MSESDELAAFLGARALEVVASIDDPTLREHVTVALRVCRRALLVVDGLDLSAHELTTGQGGAGSQAETLWQELGPRVEHLLATVQEAGEHLTMLFPGQSRSDTDGFVVDLDTAFALMESGEAPSPIRDHRTLEIDTIVRRMNADRQNILGDAIAVLAGMLQEDFARFKSRLKNPHIQGDRWALLGELQELRSKCSECLEATVATLLQAFIDADVMDILPRYTDAALRAARLRSAVVDLGYDVHRVQAAIATLDRYRARTFHDYLVQRMEHFASLPTYGHLRPSDKKEFILFRIFLFNWGEGDKGAQSLRDQVEGFSKFLDVMRAINHRRELLSHDRRYLGAAEAVLQSNLELGRVLPYLEMVYGRSEGLDKMVRQCREARAVDRKALEQQVKAARRDVEQVIGHF